MKLRVQVRTGDDQESLGEGEYAGTVPVYFIVMPDGSLQSRHNAEEEPSPEEVPEGARVERTLGNPKIVLDSGDVVYGCQVWWDFIIPQEISDRVKAAMGRLLASLDNERDAPIQELLRDFLSGKNVTKMLENHLLEYEVGPLEPEKVQ